MAESRGCFPYWLHGLSSGLSLFLWPRWSLHFGIPFVASFLILLFASSLPSIAVAVGPHGLRRFFVATQAVSLGSMVPVSVQFRRTSAGG